MRAIELADLHGSLEQLAAAERCHAANFLLPARYECIKINLNVYGRELFTPTLSHPSFLLPCSVSTEGRKRHAEAAAADAAARPAKMARQDYPAAPAAAAHAGYYGQHAAAVTPAAAYHQGYGQYPGYAQYPAAAYGQQQAYAGYQGYGY